MSFPTTFSVESAITRILFCAECEFPIDKSIVYSVFILLLKLLNYATIVCLFMMFFLNLLLIWLRCLLWASFFVYDFS